jgi:hypothetical protein
MSEPHEIGVGPGVSITTTSWVCSIALIATEKLENSCASFASTELPSALPMQ